MPSRPSWPNCLARSTHRQVADLEPLRDVRQDVLGAELSDGVAYRDLVAGQRCVEAQRVVSVERGRFFGAHRAQPATVRPGSLACMQRLAWLAYLFADVIGVLVFCAVGRRSHAEGITIAGVADHGLAVSRRNRRRVAGGPRLATADGGGPHRAGRLAEHRGDRHVVAQASSASVAASFVVVASVVTAVFLLGWRAAVGLALRRRSNV